jgi:RNA polymerase sigma-70 factor, ECF subfamily
MNDEVFARPLPLAAPAAEPDWDGLYAEQLPRVYNFFRYRVGCTPDAEDLTAVTFEKAWRARHRYRRDLASFKTWLLSIARNVAADQFRKQRDRTSLDEAAGLRSPVRNAEEDAVLRSDVNRLNILLAGVQAREREILALKYGAEMTNRDIARLTGLSESNVGTILHRTLQSLRAQW